MSERIAFTQCINNERLFAMTGPFRNSFEAISECSDNFDASLGPIRGEREFQEIRKAILGAENQNILLGLQGFSINLKYLTGLEALSGQGSSSGDTSAFTFLDETDTVGLDFFHGEAGIFPWGTAGSSPEPNNSGGNESCAELRINRRTDFAGLLNDAKCEDEQNEFNGAICRSACSNTEIDILLQDDIFFKFILENEFEGAVTADQAIVRCSFFVDDFENQLSLGPIRGESEYNELVEQLSQSQIFREALDAKENNLVSIAMDIRIPVDKRNNGTDTSSSDYLFLDEEMSSEGLQFFHVEKGVFPWADNEPQNSQNQSCVHLVAEENIVSGELDFRLFARSCEDSLSDAVLCRGQALALNETEDNQTVSFYLLLLIISTVCLLLTLILLVERQQQLTKTKLLQHNLMVVANH